MRSRLLRALVALGIFLAPLSIPASAQSIGTGCAKTAAIANALSVPSCDANGNLNVNVQVGGSGGGGSVSSSTGTPTTVTVTTASTQLLGANTNRVQALFYNPCSVTINVSLGFTATTSSYTVPVAPFSLFEPPVNFKGVINAVSTSGSCAINVTELT